MKQKFFSSSTPDIDLSIYNNVVPAPDTPSEKPFSVNEVSLKLQKSENSAPGPDRLTYFHLQKVDLEGKVLTLIFNICLKAKRVPKSWKFRKTVLIPKPGDLFLPEN